MRIIKACILAFTSPVILAGAAYATIVQGKITVQMTIVSSCTISAQPLSFGQYSPPAALNADTTVSVICTSGTPYQITLNSGTGIGATVETRKMSSAKGTLDYSLYQDPARNNIWGDTTDKNAVSGTGTGLTQNIPVYGKIFADQLAVTTGEYNDTIIATIYFKDKK